jgi:hypothetical protein
VSKAYTKIIEKIIEIGNAHPRNHQKSIQNVGSFIENMQRLQKHQNACTALQLPRKKSAELLHNRMEPKV